MGKLCASSYHDETPSWYDGYVQKIKGLAQEKLKKPPSSWHDSTEAQVQKIYKYSSPPLRLIYS